MTRTEMRLLFSGQRRRTGMATIESLMRTIVPLATNLEFVLVEQGVISEAGLARLVWLVEPTDEQPLVGIVNISMDEIGGGTLGFAEKIQVNNIGQVSFDGNIWHHFASSAVVATIVDELRVQCTPVTAPD